MMSFLDHFGTWWVVHRPRPEMAHKQAVVIATAAGGAILGGIAGNQIDKAVNNTTGERITVRLDQKRNGTRNYTVVQVASRNNPIQVGQRVRVIIGNNGSRVLAY